MKRAPVPLAALAMAGCATAQAPPTWNKPGATQQSFAVDKYACLKEAPGKVVQRDPNFQALGYREDWGLFNACMEARGRTRK
jgi:hypothetical protein